MSKYDVLNFLTKPLIGIVGISLYDKFVKDYDFGFSLDNPILNDSLILGVSIISQDLITKLVLDNVISSMGMNINSIEKYIFEPIITALIYQFLFDSIFRDRFINTKRNQFETILIGFVSSLSSIVIQNPLFGLLSGYKIR